MSMCSQNLSRACHTKIRFLSSELTQTLSSTDTKKCILFVVVGIHLCNEGTYTCITY